ncbi:MAG: KOW domain-containing RNA-binding protein [Eubacteriales bacterium]|nr:KOW domain-containing RNA-binding protein [Eubacteriales bacterium]
MVLKPGDIVCSKAGRDKYLVFIVIKVEGEYAFICDGKRRKIEKPKRKKIKHLRVGLGHSDLIENKLKDGETITNKMLRKELAEYNLGSLAKEGSVDNGKG